MNVVLNFSKKDSKRIISLMKKFSAVPLKSKHEAFRCEHKGCVITLYKSGKLLLQGANCAEVKKIFVSEFSKPEIVLGIDEVGRGEYTGPLVVSAVFADSNKLLELRDSKKTRNISASYKSLTKNILSAATFSFNAEYIDGLREQGFTLNQIEANAIDSVVSLFRAFDPDVKIVVDGSPLKLKSKGVKFEIGADDLEPTVAAASMVAKHTRNESSDNAVRKSWKIKQK